MPVQTAPGHRVFGRGFFFGVKATQNQTLISRAALTRPTNKACLFLVATFLGGRVLSRWLWKTDAEV